MTTRSDAVQLLDRTAALLDARGLAKQRHRAPTGELCVYGALEEARRDLDLSHGVACAAAQAIHPRLRELGVLMPHPDAHEDVLVNLPEGGQILVTRWFMSDDRIDVSYRKTADHRARWTPIDLAGGTFSVGISE